MDSRKVFIVGDIHGCFDELMSLLKKIDYDKSKHRLILAGDVIARGPYSLKVLEWIRENSIEVVLGNNEYEFLHSVETRTFISRSIKNLAQEMGEKVNQWADWMRTWPIYIEEDGFLVVHAGLVPNKHPKDTDMMDLIHIRTWDHGKASSGTQGIPWHDLYEDEKLVVYGHWAMQGLKIKENSIGLDSGCVYGKHLSGVWLPERTIVQVPAKKNYLTSF